jgi:hypothetical protein
MTVTMFEEHPDAPKKENPVAVFFRLRRRAKAEAATVGYDLQQFVIAPGGEETGPHHAHLVFTLAEEKPKSIDDDPDFKALLEGQAKAEREARAAEQRAGLTELRDQLKDPKKGIL